METENSEQTSVEPFEIQGDCKGVSVEVVKSNPVPKGLTPWPKGVSGNKGGRPKGLAALVRENTDDGSELVEKMLSILRGEMKVEKSYIDKDGGEHIVNESPSHRDRIAACQWLSDRGFGKAVETLVVDDRARFYGEVLLALAQAHIRGDVKIPNAN